MTPSILIVVGRQDTGEVEAQIRGSRHAWDIRLISAEALIKLVMLKENSDDPETGRKIRGVLTPMEYTRLDRLVDVMFTAATDIAPAIVEPKIIDHSLTKVSAEDGDASSGWEFTDPNLLQQKRDQIVEAMSRKLALPLIKKSRALFWSADHSNRIACTISKRYLKRSSYPYWYAFHPQWDEFLDQGEASFFVLGCMDLSTAFAVPFEVFREILPGLNTTETEKGVKYWHVHIVESDAGGLEILIPKRSSSLSVSKFAIELPVIRTGKGIVPE